MNTANKLSQIARANQQVKKSNSQQDLQKKISWGSHQYVRFVKNQCKELASKGYGSVEIKIDRTTDLFNIDEGLNRCYSLSFVVTLLQQEGFKLLTKEDYYDAQSYNLVWDKDLPQCLSEKIGMSWK